MGKMVMFFGMLSMLAVFGCKKSIENNKQVASDLAPILVDSPKTRNCNFTDIDGNVLQLRFDPINNWVEIAVDQKFVILPYIDSQEYGSFKDDVYEFINAGDEVLLLKEDQLIFIAPFGR
ncbi:hypothetical protein ACYSNX_06690 [Myroides sp. LJL115]